MNKQLNAHGAKSSVTHNRGFDHTTWRFAMRHLYISVVAVIVAATLSTPAWAQDPPTDDTDTVERSDFFDNKDVLYGEGADDTMDNQWLFTQFTMYARISARQAVIDMVKANVKNKQEQDRLIADVEGMFKMLETFSVPIAPEEFAAMKKAWEDHVTSLGCDLGVPESTDCKAVYDKSKTYADVLVGMAEQSQDQIHQERAKVSRGYLGAISKTFEANEALKKPDNYPMMSLAAQAAIFTLPEMYWKPLVVSPKSMPGNEVSFDFLSDKHGNEVVVICSDKGRAAGKVHGTTTPDLLVIEKDGRMFDFPKADMAHCRYWFIQGGSTVTDCEEGLEAFKNDLTFGDTEWLTECPEDIESLVGRDLLQFPEECKDTDGNVVSKPTSLTVTGVHKNSSGEVTGIVVEDEAGNSQIINCTDLGMLALMLETESGGTIILSPSVFSVKLQSINHFGFGNDDLDGMRVHGGVAIGEVKPFAGDHFAFVGRLGIGWFHVNGSHDNANRTPKEMGESQADMLALIGIGADVIFTEWFSLGARADFLLTLAGVGGVNGELLATFTPHPRISLHIGPTIGYLRSRVPPGIDIWDEDCNYGVMCNQVPSETKSGIVGFVAGIGFNFGLPKTEAEARARVEVEDE